MSAQEKYNGWSNWDTWNTHLWLSNDEYSYKRMRRAYNERTCELYGKELINEMGNKDDIDFNNVNWSEILEAFNE